MLTTEYLNAKASEFIASGKTPAEAYEHALRATWNANDAMRFVQHVEEQLGVERDPVHGYGFHYWRLLIQSSTRGLSEEQLDAAASVALRDGSCAWHAAAVACGNVERCCCTSCVKARQTSMRTCGQQYPLIQ